MFFLSSAEGVRFAEIATEMTERARQLGPNPLGIGRQPAGIVEVGTNERKVTTMEVEE
jgi:hypothetical protein